jgi:hypothetical protein
MNTLAAGLFDFVDLSKRIFLWFVIAAICAQTFTPTVFAASSRSNSVDVPGKILQARIDLHSTEVSPDALGFAEQLNLLPVLKRIQELKGQISSAPLSDTDRALARTELGEARQTALEIIQQVDLEVDYVEAQISEEQSLYADMLQHMTYERDRSVALTNVAGFGANGILWTLCEAIAIPTYAHPNLSVPSGILGIAAGLVPTFASLYAMKQVSGKKYSYKEEPNMLSKLFDLKVGLRSEYPDSVWTFLTTVPPNDPTGKRRVDQIIDRWVEDKNLPSFKSRDSVRQVELITATRSIPKTLTIDLLSTRQAMLDQLSSEVLKINRLLLELMLVARGAKQI